MREFAHLYASIDETMRTTEKVDAVADYFRGADPADAAWAVWFLSGGRPKRLIPVRRLAQWAMEESGVPGWLFEECYDAVGDLAETMSLLLPDAVGESDQPLHRWVEMRVLPLAAQSEEEQRSSVVDAWRELSGGQRFVWNKLITGGFRVGVSQQLVVRALSRATGVAEAVVAHRLAGKWVPSPEAYAALFADETSDADASRPYPFYLAYALEDELEDLGPSDEWQAEWKWDGIRAQVIRRNGQTYIWSRGEELVTERFPEIASAAEWLPAGTVLDGEIMPWKSGKPLPFAQLQRRIGRKTLGPKILSEVPVVLVVYDVLEVDGADVRGQPLAWRRAKLDEVIARAASVAFVPSPIVSLATWADARDAFRAARAMSAEGLMLKRRAAPYGVGRRKGGWWKWKVKPYSVDAVMIYAQAGHGRRASLHTDYTFGVWDNGVLVPFAKAYSGLTDAEIRELDAWIRRNTVEKFGPVRSVKPEQVFELGFEGIQPSSRHKSGVAVRFPRILRWRTDKKPEDADSVAALRDLMTTPEPA
ncbi:MAG TPA: ATP-dependent DNA ligase [Gemmatimonadaceae bacterium]|nr:ATP-dependent DNA ligase [Gemmatimonadaceae bacterium]